MTTEWTTAQLQALIAGTDKRAPVQGLTGGIPWSMHLRAYDAYSKRWSPQPALIEGGCRGGFDVKELDEFIPGWRDEVSEIAVLRQSIASISVELLAARAALEKITGIFDANYGRQNEKLADIGSIARSAAQSPSKEA